MDNLQEDIRNPQLPASTIKPGTMLDKQSLIALLVLVISEFIAFGVNYGTTGFCLDDWTMLWRLYFRTHNCLTMPVQYFLSDPAISARPLQALYFSWLYLLFGTNAQLWHMFNGAVEVFGAWCLFLSIRILARSQFLALLGGILFILCPYHDATHYYVVASSMTLSISLYLLSLYCTIKASLTGSTRGHLYALVFFTIALFNHEAILPLFLVNLWFLYFARPSSSRALFTLKMALLYVLPICALIGIQRLLFPLFNLGDHRQVVLSLAAVVAVIKHGFRCLFGRGTYVFLCQRLQFGIISFRQTRLILSLLALAGAICAGVFAMSKRQRDSFALSASFRQAVRLYAVTLLLPGLLTIVTSYTIYAIAVVYHPILTTPVNRMNYGASIGVVLCAIFVIGSVYAALCSLTRNQFFAKTAILALVIPFFWGLTLANLGLSQKWIEAAQMQRQVADCIIKHRLAITKDCSLILVGCPRYNYWAGVCDGPWDFACIARILLNYPDLNANVLSDRLTLLDGCNLKDSSMGVHLGSYPIKGLKLLILPRDELHTVNNLREFITAVTPYYAISQVPPEVFHSWQAAGNKTCGN
jgi:hypothetical protein